MGSVKVAGTELHYERAGEGEPMLLIQGMSATHLTWGRPFLERLERHLDCVIYDHRGMGRSGRAELPFTVADLADDALGLLDALGIDSAHVVGISMGGMIAQELTLARPDRVRTLTLGATYCGGPEGSLMAAEDVQLLGAAMQSGEPEQIRRAMWEINLSPAFRADDGRYAGFLEMADALPAPRAVVMEQMRACAAHDTSARLGQIAVPTLVVHGTADRLLRVSNGHQIAALLSVEPALLEDVGHMFWWEQPERSAELIRDHALAPA